MAGRRSRQRWPEGGGMEKERLTAFSDGVIAVIITIMVLRVEDAS